MKTPNVEVNFRIQNLDTAYREVADCTMFAMVFAILLNIVDFWLWVAAGWWGFWR
jgi:hypothetical protein